MNTERLSLIAQGILSDIEKSKSEALVDKLVKQISNQVSNPDQPQHQEAVSSTLEQLYRSLDSAPSNDFPPTWFQIIGEFGGAENLGKNLHQKIEEIFNRNQITPTVAQKELQKISQEIKNLKNALSQLVSGFRALNIGEVKLDINQCEIGILIPRAFVKNELENFSKELSEIRKILNVFLEIETGSRGGIEIREISSSELSVFLDSSHSIGLMLVVALERLILAYKRILEIKSMHKELKKMDVPEEKLSGIEEHSNSIIDSEINNIVPEIMKRFYKNPDQGRKHELTLELKSALRKIANRIDRGFNIEVRVETPDEKDRDQEENENEKFLVIDEINSKRKTLQYLKTEGPPILSLPESNQEKESKKDEDNESGEGK